MSITLDDTVGASTANTYVNLADAESYVTNHYVPTATLVAWKSASNDVKSKALIQATLLLDRLVVWNGYVPEESLQSLAWPRANAVDRHNRIIDDAVVPPFITEFTVETVLWLITQGGVTPEESSSQFSSIKVEGIDISYAKGEGRSSLVYLPDSVTSALTPMGRYSVVLPNSAFSVPIMRA